ncbi:MAG: T9SS type A sorting domain-containing protein [Saprospiraceae bacterium]|nr:MAG: protease-associated PA domain-containing protein [Bacteroidetes bacterium OLB9]MCO6463022.1 T9SS type A sorting domain-containing protein [Saprospiraceae bacterium]
MRIFFTKHFLLVVLGFLSLQVMGQRINHLIIESPANLAGEYPIQRAAFGDKAEVEVTGKPVFAVGPNGKYEACEAITNAAEVTGNIAFIDRGTCGFSVKAYNAQNGGAIAVVVCNNNANSPNEIIGMAAGDFADQVTIPAFMTSYATCQKIRASILDGTLESVKLGNFCKVTDVEGDDIIWGIGEDANGNRGDFKGGLNGWTISTENTWVWNADGEVVGGQYLGGDFRSVFSPSGCNGIVVFNSDLYDFNQSCPPVCTGELVSPNISLDGINVEGIVVEFTQALRQYRSKYFIAVSTDGGATWSDTLQFNQEHPTNSAHILERKALPLTGLDGATQFRFKFIYEGNYYYWALDDIVVRNAKVIDTKIETNFFAVAPSLKVPQSQVAPMYFLADVSNKGNATGSNASLNVVIVDSNESPVAAFTEPLGDISSGQTIENTFFSDTFTPDAKPEAYVGAYVISTDEEDGNENNNQALFYFDVTENTFANLYTEDEIGQAYMKDVTEIWAVDPTNYVTIGNSYYLPKGNGWTVDKVRFGLKNQLDEIEGTGQIRVDLFEWDDQDGGVVRGVEPTERTLVGTNTIFLEEIDNLRNIEIPLFGVDEDGNQDEDSEVVLKDNTQYVLVAHSQPFDPSTPRYQFLTYNGFGLDDAYARSIYTEATNFVLDSLDKKRYGGSFYNDDGTQGDEADRTFSPLGNNQTLYSFTVVYLEMDIKKSTSTYNVDNTASAKVFPNPAARELYIDVTLENTSNVKVELVAIDGRVVASKSFDAVKDSRLKLNLNNVASGTYTALIHTDKGVLSKKVVVQK